ncbi:MAG: metacaspase [Acidimicrobiaceae bacterium]
MDDTAAASSPSPEGVVDSPFRDRAPVVRAPTTEAASHVYGLIIGINDYPGDTSDLHGAVPDAEDMSDVLAMNGVPAPNVRTLLDAAASTTSINDALQWLVSTTRIDSTVVLFYAGHVRKISDQTEAIVAADGGVLPDSYLAKQTEGLPAHNVWIVMATCYGGGFTELMAPGRILTAAADANNLAYENDSFGRSYLDEYLIHQALLQGRSEGPTAQQAFAYAQAGLQRDYPDRALTEFDQSTEAISLDGVHRDTPAPPPEAPEGPPGGGPVPPVVPPTPPSSPPTAPSPCQNIFGLLCPPGSRS